MKRLFIENISVGTHIGNGDHNTFLLTLKADFYINCLSKPLLNFRLVRSLINFEIQHNEENFFLEVGKSCLSTGSCKSENYYFKLYCMYLLYLKKFFF